MAKAATIGKQAKTDVPDALFGEHQMRPAEYREGELITPHG